MDKRRKYLIGLDTETCNGIVVGDSIDLSNSLVYDLGWQVCDKHGNVYEKRSYLIREVFVGMKDIMASAYYADKIPMYWEQVKSGQRKIASLYDVRKQLFEDIKNYNIENVFAHNARFDYNALNTTIRYITKSKIRYFLPYNIEWWDTLKMASDTFGKEKMYRQFCLDNNYMTKHSTPRPRLTAEILFRYVTQNLDFVENHTGLEDIEIETFLMACMFAKHKKMRKALFE